MKIVNIWKFLELKMNGKCPTPRAQKIDKSPPYPGGTLGDSLDTSIKSSSNLKELWRHKMDLYFRDSIKITSLEVLMLWCS